MRNYIDTAQDASGNALVGALIKVLNYPSLTNATIYSDNGLTPIANNTVATDQTGQFSFFVADGDYALQFTYAGTLYKTQSPVSMFDGAAQLTFQDSGAVNAYAIVNSALEKALRAGLRCSMQVTNSNTGASTLQYNGLAARPIVYTGGGAIGPSTLLATGIYGFEYDGTNWQIRYQVALYYPQTAAEAAAGVTPLQFSYPEMQLFRYMTNAQIASIQGNGLTDTTSGWQSAMLVAAAGGGRTLNVPAGNYVASAKTTLARSIWVLGATERGVLSPPASLGSGINCTFAGPIFEYSPGGLTAADILIEGLNIQGNKGTYGAGNGLNFSNCSNVHIRRCVVASFGTNGINYTAGAGAGYGLTLRDVYSAQNGNANFFIDADDSVCDRLESDGGAYGLQTGSNSQNLQISDCHFEGATSWCMSLGGVRTRATGNYLRSTSVGGSCIQLLSTAAKTRLAENCCFGSGGANTPLGISVNGAATEYILTGNYVTNCNIACQVGDGGNGVINGNVLEGTATGLDTTSTTLYGTVIGNVITGATNSINHNSGSKFIYVGNRLDDGAGNYKAPTIVAGTPIILGANATNLLSSGLGSFDVTYSASMSIDASVAENFRIPATNGTAFTINLPTNASPGKRIVVKIINTSGGALGAVTWAAGYKLAAWTSPATGFNRSIEYQYDNSNGNWVEMSRTTVDVPN